MILPNFPMVSQRTRVSTDGTSPNADFDCVPASIGACILWYQGKSQWDAEINPDRLLDLAYREGYTGGTAATTYIPVLQKLGYRLYPLSGQYALLTEQAHKLIQAKKPVIFTEVDPWCSDYQRNVLGWTHVCVFFGETNGGLTALDPFSAQPVTRSDSEWQQLLRFNQIWVVEPLNGTHTTNGDVTMLALTDPMGQHFTETASGRWHCKETNVDLAFANLTFYRIYGGIFRLPRTPEIYLKQYPGTALQVCEAAIIAYDPTDVFKQKPVGSGPVYLLKITEDIGQQLIARSLISELQTQITDLTNQITQLKAEATNKPDVSGLQAQLQSYQAAFNQLEALVSQMKGKVY